MKTNKNKETVTYNLEIMSVVTSKLKPNYCAVFQVQKTSDYVYPDTSETA